MNDLNILANSINSSVLLDNKEYKVIHNKTKEVLLVTEDYIEVEEFIVNWINELKKIDNLIDCYNKRKNEH